MVYDQSGISGANPGSPAVVISSYKSYLIWLEANTSGNEVEDRLIHWEKIDDHQGATVHYLDIFYHMEKQFGPLKVLTHCKYPLDHN